MKKISPEQLKERLEKEELTILDVRTVEKFNHGRLKHPKARNIRVFKEDIFSLEEKDGKMPFSPEEEIIVTCSSGNSASRCTRILTDRGYNVTVLDGGIKAWDKMNE